MFKIGNKKIINERSETIKDGSENVGNCGRSKVPHRFQMKFIHEFFLFCSRNEVNKNTGYPAINLRSNLCTYICIYTTLPKQPFGISV